MVCLRRFIAVSGLFLALCAIGGPQAVGADAPKRIAILIGNSDYNLDNHVDKLGVEVPGNYFPDLANPCNDVKLIKEKLAVANFEIHDYCNLQQAEFSNAYSSLHAELKSLPKGSLVFVYYAGHGMQFNGYAFTIPVKFELDHTQIDRKSDTYKVAFFRKRANEIARIFRDLPDDFDVAVVIALDNCRTSPVTQKVAYNEAVTIHTPPNALVQYATIAGKGAPDGDGVDSDYAKALAEALARGGDVGDAMSQTGAKIWADYRNEKTPTYAETTSGEAFKALKYIPLKVGAVETASLVTEPVVRRKQVIRNIYDGVSLDILWCEGPGEEARYKYAKSFAEKVSEVSHDMGVGRIQVKPLSEANNRDNGYGRVSRNIMRYDPPQLANGKAMPDERSILVNLAIKFPEANFLPVRGNGVGGHATVNYVSAFVCGRVPN